MNGDVKIVLPNTDKSEYNSGQLTIERLDSINKAMAEAKASKDYTSYYELINVYFDEVYPILDNRKSASTKLYLYKQRNLVQKANNFCHKTFGGKYPEFVIELFHNLEIDLRDIAQESGLGVPKGQGTNFGMASGR